MGVGGPEGYVANLAPMMSSAKQDWRTPAVVLERVCRLGPIDLDPCAAANPRHWFADWNLTPTNLDTWQRDGLGSSWHSLVSSGGVAFVNSPYGREIGTWVAKCQTEAALGCEIVGLWPARPDTRWFPWATANAICFWRGRLKFESDDGPLAPAPFPSCLPYWGPRATLFRDCFADAGHVVMLR